MQNTKKKSTYNFHQIYPLVFSLLFVHLGFTQGIKTTKISKQLYSNDSLLSKPIQKSRISILLDDSFIIGGYNNSVVYYSNNFRNLSAHSGFSLGVEQYFPISGNVLLNTGLNYAQRNFKHNTPEGNVAFRNNYLDLSAAVSYEIPVLRQFDFRLILGSSTSAKLNSVGNDYSSNYLSNENNFVYTVSDFHKFDFGWFFGFSAEYKNFIVRARSYSGFIKIDKKDQGMLNSFNIEFGYFLFRNKK